MSANSIKKSCGRNVRTYVRNGHNKHAWRPLRSTQQVGPSEGKKRPRGRLDPSERLFSQAAIGKISTFFGNSYFFLPTKKFPNFRQNQKLISIKYCGMDQFETGRLPTGPLINAVERPVSGWSIPQY